MKSEMDDDDDKVLYPKIGKTEITIDKVLSNLLVNEVGFTYSIKNFIVLLSSLIFFILIVCLYQFNKNSNLNINHLTSPH
jgi:hypothetical protein